MVDPLKALSRLSSWGRSIEPTIASISTDEDYATFNCWDSQYAYSGIIVRWICVTENE